MTIDSLKELEKVVKLCRKHGVTTIKIDNIEMQISQTEEKPRQAKLELDIPEAKISVPQFNGQQIDKITTEELTPEQLMFYSSEGHIEAQ